MGSVIHGASHGAIKHFRENPAAMAVYWIYLARANADNRAWPSLRGLEADTGWNKDTCAKGRKWLVDHGALELDKDYIRPEWRKLDEVERKQRQNIDSAEYYRPTGVLIMENVTYPMLYFGALSAQPEQDIPDVPPHRTPTPPDADATGRRPGGTELSTKSELDSISEDDSSQSIALSDIFRKWNSIKRGDISAKDRQTIPDDVKEYGAELVWIAMSKAKERATKPIYSWQYVVKVIDELASAKKGVAAPSTYHTMSPAVEAQPAAPPLKGAELDAYLKTVEAEYGRSVAPAGEGKSA